MKDNPTVLVTALVLAAVVMLVLGATAIVCRHVERMAELGYQEDSVPRSFKTHWRKCK